MSYWFDLKYALRLLGRNRGHTALCVFAVALSLAISLVVFALAYNTSYRPFDFPGSENWTYLYSLNTENNTAESIDSIDLYLSTDGGSAERFLGVWGHPRCGPVQA